MAVPKRKTSRSKTHSRRSANRSIKPAPKSVCPNCATAKPPHIVCANCGWYKGRVAVSVD
ncbi:MAG: 50S ribosomal protein L32 [Actinobacteria bacterium]|nr:50S ribosomal protein L32 [Actinomycetota bacterium]MSV94048.1 50S ribosomal protein L32 [Actinomycetota bacterium]MSW60755.1 50S ribosomal protein L32 [Actinomycetota bacterium]